MGGHRDARVTVPMSAGLADAPASGATAAASGAGPIGFTGTVGRSAATTAGLVQVGDAGTRATVPLVPDTWPPNDTAPAAE